MDVQVRYKKLLADAAECAELRDRATDAEKRELFGRLSEHLSDLASLMRPAAELPNAETPPSQLNSTPKPPAAEMTV